MQTRRAALLAPMVALSLALLPGCPQEGVPSTQATTTPQPSSNPAVTTPRDYFFPPSATSRYTFDLSISGSTSTSSVVLEVASYSENKANLRSQGSTTLDVTVEVEADGTLKVSGLGPASKRLPTSYFTSQDMVIAEASGSTPALKSSALGQETLTLPAGTFQCIKVEESDSKDKAHFWYTKDVGVPVKMAFFDASGNLSFEFTLRSFVKQATAPASLPDLNSAFWLDVFAPQVKTKAVYRMMQGASTQGDVTAEVLEVSAGTYTYYKTAGANGGAVTSNREYPILLDSFKEPGLTLEAVAVESISVPFGVVSDCTKISLTKAGQSSPFLHVWVAKPYGVVKASDGASSFELTSFEAIAAAPQVTTYETRTVSTLAGSSAGMAEGVGTAAKFNVPLGLSVDGNGTLHVADWGNGRIRLVSQNGTVSPLAGSTSGFADGTGSAAKFLLPAGTALDTNGDLIVADTGNNRIRRVTAAGVVTTILGGTPGYAEGTTGSALISGPTAVAVDSNRNIYFADMNNGRIRRITPSGTVSTLAGSSPTGFADGQGSAAKFNQPVGMAIDSTGNLYIADGMNHRIRKVTPGGLVTTLAGSGQVGFQDGPSANARFNYPAAVAVDAQNNVYVADMGNHLARKISSTGTVTTLAGRVKPGDADGAQNQAGFYLPQGIAVDGQGTVYVSDSNNHRIRKIQ